MKPNDHSNKILSQISTMLLEADDVWVRKFCILPRYCHITKKWFWLQYGQRAIVGCEALSEYRFVTWWHSDQAHTMWLLKGSYNMEDETGVDDVQ